MFLPFGSALITTRSAPSAENNFGASSKDAPLAQSIAIFKPFRFNPAPTSSRRKARYFSLRLVSDWGMGSGEWGVGDKEVTFPIPDSPLPAPHSPVKLRSIARSVSSSSFRPDAEKTFIPLSSYELCEAEMTT